MLFLRFTYACLSGGQLRSESRVTVRPVDVDLPHVQCLLTPTLKCWSRLTLYMRSFDTHWQVKSSQRQQTAEAGGEVMRSVRARSVGLGGVMHGASSFYNPRVLPRTCAGWLYIVLMLGSLLQAWRALSSDYFV